MAKVAKHDCTIYLVRHGETKWNKIHRIEGHQNSSLTKNGKVQAKKLSKILNQVNFDAAFASDMLRAKRTAEIVTQDKKLAVLTSKALRERDFGNYAGRFFKELAEELKDRLETRARLEDQSLKKSAKLRLAPGVENDEELIGRFITYLREIAVAYAGKTVLIVSHGGAMRLFLVHIGFAPPESLGYNSVSNTGYVKLLSDGIDFFVEETFGIKVQRIGNEKK